jgi:serine/threonine protein kinase
MGVVFKARHRRMDRVVALKVLAPSVTRSAEAVQRFQREVRAAAKLNHPNIVLAHDASEEDGTRYLVMEYVEGTNLGALVRQKGPLSTAEAIDYTLQAAQGLDYAHRQNIVHRDVKPENLLLDGSGTVKILDLGLARLNDAVGRPGSVTLTSAGSMMGTPEFMAPEQAVNARFADRRSDIYSLGCTMYCLLVGRAPYEGNSVFEKLTAHRERSIPDLSQKRDDVPRGLDAAFRKMVAKRPEDRYQSMGEMIHDLEAVRSGAAASTTSCTMTSQATATGATATQAAANGSDVPAPNDVRAAGPNKLLIVGGTIVICLVLLLIRLLLG